MRITKAMIFLLVSILLVASVVFSAGKGDKTATATETTQVTETQKVTQTNSEKIAELQTKLEEIAKTSAAPRAGEQINWWVISGGATNGSSTNYSLSGTVGQTAVGYGTSTNYGLSHGYWQDFTSTGCCDKPGDFNNDGNVDISDLTAMVDFMFAGGPAATCSDEADVNGDNAVDISDLTYRVDFMFAGGPAPICGTTGS